MNNHYAHRMATEKAGGVGWSHCFQKQNKTCKKRNQTPFDTMKNNQNKVAIVTGSSRGIGAAIAKRLAADGFAVIVNYAGGAAAAENVVREIQAAGGQAAAVQADVSIPAEVASLFDKAEEIFGGADVGRRTVSSSPFRLNTLRQFSSHPRRPRRQTVPRLL
jgi:3-oxoacyl-ACP reductase-like protein